VYDKLGVQSRAAAMFETLLKIVPEHEAAGAALEKTKLH
jgi:hypothetical protein